jgi:uncharacterized protein (DUF885 family)
MMSLKKWTVAAICGLLLAACKQETPAPPPKLNAEEMFARLEHDYVVFFMTHFPVVATYLGGAAFDPALFYVDQKLRNHAADALVQEDARWSEFRDRFTAVDTTALSPRRLIDRTVALAQIEFLLHQHRVLRHQERALDTYVDEPFRGVDWQIQAMTSTGPETYGTDGEWQQVIARVRKIPTYLATAEKQIAAGVAAKNTPDWRVLVGYGLRSTVADADYFSKTLPAIAAKNIGGEERDALLNQLQTVGNEAAAAYLHLRDFVATTFFDDATKMDVSGVKPEFREDRYALGEKEYNWALKNNLRLQSTARRLWTESWPVVQKTREDMIALAREIAKNRQMEVPPEGETAVRTVFDVLTQDAPKNDEEMIALYRSTGERIVDYARRTGLFDVPAEYRLDVSVTPPPLRSSIDGAAYYPAPPFKSSGVGRFYVSPTDNDPVELGQQHNRAAVPDLAAHEGFPGHDWHYKVMSQNRAAISALRWLTPGAVEDSSSMWQDSMAAEGWALYSEALLSEPQKDAPNGFYTPEERLYQLRGKLYRDLRVRIDTGIHTGRMSFDDAVTLFSEVVDFLPGSCSDPKATAVDAKRVSCESAHGAITRYSRWPTQAITYRLGKDQIFALREAAQERLGEKFDAKRFHVEFMKQGTIPTAYFSDVLLDELESSATPVAPTPSGSVTTGN